MQSRYCIACGCEDLIAMPLMHLIVLDGECWSYVDTFACPECGRMEIYAKPEEIKKAIQNKKIDEEREAKLASLKKELDRLKSHHSELASLIADENQTVKAIREAKELMNSLENDIRSLESKISETSNGYNIHYW